MTMRRRLDVNLGELDQIIDRSTRAPLSESEGQKLKTALHAMAERLLGNGIRRKPVPFCRRMRLPPRSRTPANPHWPVMGAMAPLRLVAQIRLPSRTPRSIPATGVRNAVKEKCTVRRRRQRWCGS